MQSRHPEGRAEDRARPRGRVLIVEDEVLLCMVVEDALTHEGYEIVGIARSADEAVSIAVARRPDLVLMDIRLAANTDGIAAAAEILERTGIRSLMATAHTDATTLERAQAAHPLGWLPKPYDEQELVRAVAKALHPGEAPR
jgi:DNA-binding NarL/FixJ family response regulator